MCECENRQAGAYRMVFGGWPEGSRRPSGKLLPEAVRRERLDDTLSHCRELAQRGNHGRSIEDINIAEGYLRGDLNVVLVATPLDSAMLSQVRYHKAFCQIPRSTNHYPDSAVSDVQVAHERGASYRPHGDQIAVFVDIAKSAERPQILVSSLVRLEVLDHPLDIGRNANHFSLFSIDRLGRSFDVVGGFAKGEVDVADVLDASATGDCYHQLVESRSQMVDSLRDEKEKTVGETPRQLDFREAISTLRVTLYNKSVGLTFEQGSDFPFHLIDVIIGSANFHSGPA
jgi:hypothetical protein